MSDLAHWKKVAKSGSFNHKQVSEMYRMYRKGHGRFGGKFDPLGKVTAKVTAKVKGFKKDIMDKFKSSKLARFTPSRTTDPYTLGKVFDVINNRRKLVKSDEKAVREKSINEAKNKVEQHKIKKDIFLQANPELYYEHTERILTEINGDRFAQFIVDDWPNFLNPETNDWVYEGYRNGTLGIDGYTELLNEYDEPQGVASQVLGDSHTDADSTELADFIMNNIDFILDNEDALSDYYDILNEEENLEIALDITESKMPVNPLDIMAKEVKLYKPNHAKINFPKRALSKLSNVFNNKRL